MSKYAYKQLTARPAPARGTTDQILCYADGTAAAFGTDGACGCAT